MRGRFCTFLRRYRPLSDNLWTRDGCELEAYRCGVRQGDLRYLLSAVRALTILRFVALRLEGPRITQLVTLVRINLARTCTRHTHRQIDVIIIASKDVIQINIRVLCLSFSTLLCSDRVLSLARVRVDDSCTDALRFDLVHASNPCICRVSLTGLIT